MIAAMAHTPGYDENAAGGAAGAPDAGSGWKVARVNITRGQFAKQRRT